MQKTCTSETRRATDVQVFNLGIICSPRFQSIIICFIIFRDVRIFKSEGKEKSDQGKTAGEHE